MNTFIEYFLKKFIFLIAVGLHWCAQAFSHCGEWKLLSSCGARASHWGGFSSCRAQTLEYAGFSSCGSWALEHRLSSRGTRGLVAPWPVESSWTGIRPVSPALGSRFLTTGPPGKSLFCFVLFSYVSGMGLRSLYFLKFLEWFWSLSQKKRGARLFVTWKEMWYKSYLFLKFLLEYSWFTMLR